MTTRSRPSPRSSGNPACTGDLPQQKPGDPEKGKEAFETRGCMACHSMGEGGEKQGGTFAANLSREGEKDNYDYLVRWVHNPRQRTLPYCPFEKKDLTAEDYKRHGLPFVFDLEHTKCPNDGHELQVQQMTPMPSLRLTEDEARDIASYLMTRKHDNATYADADYLDDPKLKNAGLFLVRYLRLRRLPRDRRPRRRAAHRHRADQGRLEADRAPGFRAARATRPSAKAGTPTRASSSTSWQNPAVYDQGKEKAKQDRLKMPNFNLSKPEIDEVTTFLRGLGRFHRAGALLLRRRPTSGRTSSTAGGWSASTTAWAATRCTSGRPPSSTRCRATRIRTGRIRSRPR